MFSPQRILELLSDGRFHSGTELGKHIGCSRAAIWKAIQALQAAGVEIYSVQGKGYRLSSPIELLSAPRILTAIPTALRSRVTQLDVHYEIPSTNAYLLEISRNDAQSGHACFAEFQSEGRGRRDRKWISPLGGNIYASLLWIFPAGVMQIGGLSLAVAVAVGRALREIGLSNVDVKWPNDILVHGHKLAGILLEVAGEASGPCQVVIGVGINLRMPDKAGQEIQQAWTDLETVLGKPVERNRLAGVLLSHLVSILSEFEVTGLAPFLDEWQAMDCFADREVLLELPNGTIKGIAKGVDATGALMLAQDGVVRRFVSGEVSLRPTLASEA